MNRKLNLIISGKGGVGRTFFAIHYLQQLKEWGIPYHAVEFNPDILTLQRFHPETRVFDLSEPDALDGFTSSLMPFQDAPGLVVADCSTGVTNLMVLFFRRYATEEVLEEAGIELTFIIPVNHEPDSIEQAT